MSSTEDIAKTLAGVIGENDSESTVTQFLDTGYPELNNALSSRFDGGFPVGRIVEMAGPASSGKTALATRAMAAAQKMGGIAAFMDHERSFSTVLAPKLGLDITPGRFIFKKPVTFEQSIDLSKQIMDTVRSKKLISNDAPICLVYDSLASMVAQSVLFDNKNKERDASSRNMNDNTALARATSAHMPALAMMAEEYNVCMIFLNQVRTKIGVIYGDPRTTPGGEAPKFYASTRVMLGARAITDSKRGQIGQQVTANIIKNKVSRPFGTAQWRFMFNDNDGSGRFDFERSMVDYLIREEWLEKASRNGYAMWNGKQISFEQLARDIEARGAMDELLALLPEKHDFEVVADAAMIGEEAAE